MSDFPTLEPAFTLQVAIDPPMDIGSASRGTPLTVVPMIGGVVKSEPGFSPAIDAKLKGVGNDYIHNDRGGKHMRLNAHAVLETADGALIYLNYTGCVEITSAVKAVLEDSPEATSTPFGSSFTTHLTFETGSDAYKELETSVFVATGRFVVAKDDNNKPKPVPVVVEYKVGRVVIKHG